MYGRHCQRYRAVRRDRFGRPTRARLNGGRTTLSFRQSVHTLCKRPSPCSTQRSPPLGTSLKGAGEVPLGTSPAPLERTISFLGPILSTDVAGTHCTRCTFLPAGGITLCFRRLVFLYCRRKAHLLLCSPTATFGRPPLVAVRAFSRGGITALFPPHISYCPREKCALASL